MQQRVDAPCFGSLQATWDFSSHWKSVDISGAIIRATILKVCYQDSDQRNSSKMPGKNGPRDQKGGHLGHLDLQARHIITMSPVKSIWYME